MLWTARSWPSHRPLRPAGENRRARVASMGSQQWKPMLHTTE